jgi:hypothetical protein
MPQDAILGYFYLRNGLFAIRASPGLTSWDILSRPCGTGLGGNVYPGLRPGLLSAVPTGLNLEGSCRLFSPILFQFFTVRLSRALIQDGDYQRCQGLLRR